MVFELCARTDTQTNRCRTLAVISRRGQLVSRCEYLWWYCRRRGWASYCRLGWCRRHRRGCCRRCGQWRHHGHRLDGSRCHGDRSEATGDDRTLRLVRWLLWSRPELYVLQPNLHESNLEWTIVESAQVKPVAVPLRIFLKKECRPYFGACGSWGNQYLMWNTEVQNNEVKIHFLTYIFNTEHNTPEVIIPLKNGLLQEKQSRHKWNDRKQFTL